MLSALHSVATYLSIWLLDGFASGAELRQRVMGADWTLFKHSGIVLSATKAILINGIVHARGNCGGSFIGVHLYTLYFS